jgi:hypothetical protein
MPPIRYSEAWGKLACEEKPKAEKSRVRHPLK